MFAPHVCAPYNTLPARALLLLTIVTAVPVATGHSAGSTKFDAEQTMRLFKLAAVSTKGDDDASVSAFTATVPAAAPARAPVAPSGGAGSSLGATRAVERPPAVMVSTTSRL